MEYSILMHEPEDDVGVAVDLKAGTEARAVPLEGKYVGTVEVKEDIPGTWTYTRRRR